MFTARFNNVRPLKDKTQYRAAFSKTFALVTGGNEKRKRSGY